MFKSFFNLIKKYYLYSFLLFIILIVAKFYSTKKESTETPNNILISSNLQDSTLIDERDQQEYRIRRFDNQWWMIDNLNFDMGDNLFYNEIYIGLGSYSYKNTPALATKYGRLYDLSAAVNACPKGWRLPSKKEWEKLNKKHANCEWNRNSATGNTRVTLPSFEPVAGGRGSILGLAIKDYKEKGCQALSNFIGLEREGNYWCQEESNKPYFFKINLEICEAKVTHYQASSTRKTLAQGKFLSCRCIKE